VKGLSGTGKGLVGLGGLVWHLHTPESDSNEILIAVVCVSSD
jgi:hypothetical protein